MSLFMMCTGTLTADPQSRVGQSGKRFALCNLRVPSDGADAMLVSAIVFGDESIDKLMACAKGDSICMGGRGALKSWTGKDGAERTGLSLTATRVMTPYEFDKRRKATTDRGGDDDR